MLDKRIIDLPLSKGMDQKDDPKSAPGGIALVYNAVYRKRNRVDKRAGTSALTASGGSGTPSQALSTYGNELLQWSDNNLYAYSPSVDKWFNRGAAYSVGVKFEPVSGRDDYPYQPDSAYLSGVTLTVSRNSSSSDMLYYSIVDQTTLTRVIDDEPIEVGYSPRVLSFKGRFYVIYAYDTGIRMKRINPLTGVIELTVSTAADIFLDDPDLAVVYGYVFDATASENQICVAYGTTANNIKLLFYNQNLAPALSDATIATRSDIFISLTPLSGDRFMCIYGTFNGKVFMRLITAGVPGAAWDSTYTTVEVNGYHRSATGYEEAGLFYVYLTYIETTEGPAFSEINNFSVNLTSGVLGGFPGVHSVGLASRMFAYNGKHYLFAAHISDLQPILFLFDQDLRIVAKYLEGKLSEEAILHNPPNVSNPFPGKFTAPTSYINRIDGPSLVGQVEVDFLDKHKFNAVEIGKVLHIVGGFMSMYDGASVVEHGFHVYPEGLKIGANLVDALANGTYLYVATYEWTDAKGYRHQSAPSVPLSVVISGGVAKTISVPMLQLTQKYAPRSGVKIVLWRTLVNQRDVYYRCAEKYNQVLVRFQTFGAGTNVAITDANITKNEVLYTTGGVLENAPAPAAKHIKVFGNRIFLSGLETSEIAYSKEWVEGYPLEFAGEFRQPMPAEFGPVTAIETLDDRFVICQERRLSFIYGEGPNLLGQGAFSVPKEITNKLTSVENLSTCSVSGGLIFKCEKGFFLYSNAGVAYIGANVEDYNSLNLTSANLVPGTEEIRFTHSDGPALIYNAEFNTWSVWTNYEAVDAVYLNQVYYHAKPSGGIYRETVGSFTDSGVRVPIQIVTNWLTLSSIAGFMRIYRAFFIGEYRSPHVLQLSAGFDFETTWLTSASYTAQAGRPYKFSAHMKRQKCEAVRFKLEELSDPASPTPGESLTLTSLSLQLGVKQGMAKLGKTHRVAMEQ